jgi:hypothetical protein
MRFNQTIGSASCTAVLVLKQKKTGTCSMVQRAYFIICSANGRGKDSVPQAQTRARIKDQTASCH